MGLIRAKPKPCHISLISRQAGQPIRMTCPREKIMWKNQGGPGMDWEPIPQLQQGTELLQPSTCLWRLLALSLAGDRSSGSCNHLVFLLRLQTSLNFWIRIYHGSNCAQWLEEAKIPMWPLLPHNNPLACSLYLKKGVIFFFLLYAPFVANSLFAIKLT